MDDIVVRSQFTDVYPPRHMALTDFLMKGMEAHGDKLAYVDPTENRQLTFSEVGKYIQNVAGALHRRGLRKGDVVCIFSPNTLEYVLAFHGAIAAGGIITTVNPAYTAGELLVRLNDCGAKYIVTIPPLAKLTGEACNKYGKMKAKFVFGEASGLRGYESFSELMKDGPPAPPVEINTKEDVCCLPYSSGTTGLPKGVMLTHYNMVANLCQITHPSLVAGLNLEREVIIGVLPFFHSFGICTLLNLSLLVGNLTIIVPKFDLKVYLESIQKYKVTTLMIVPPLAVVLAKHPMVAEYDLSSVNLVTCGAAPLSSALTMELQNKMPKVEGIRQGYGLTETSPVVSTSSGTKYGSAGVLIPDTELKVIDLDTGVALGSYRQGELCIRGPQVMKGYLNNEEATKRTIDSEGWLHTGDIGYYDKDGDIFIIDRLKELIKYKAYQVAPAELEALLLQHPAVADVAVIGVPDELSGELPRAYIVLKPDAWASAEDLIKFVSGQVAPHKKLRGGVEFLQEVPKSPSGKIMRRVLKQQVLNKANL